jgi:hypothetical protein
VTRLATTITVVKRATCGDGFSSLPLAKASSGGGGIHLLRAVADLMARLITPKAFEKHFMSGAGGGDFSLVSVPDR